MPAYCLVRNHRDEYSLPAPTALPGARGVADSYLQSGQPRHRSDDLRERKVSISTVDMMGYATPNLVRFAAEDATFTNDGDPYQ